jgi:hypothetical protein
MRSLTLKCSVVSTKRPPLNLQDIPVSLKRTSGTNTWSGSATVQVDDALKVDAAVVSIEDSPWSIDITMDCPNGKPPATVFHDDGTIPHGGGEGISKTVQVPANPCPPQLT